jgi:HSP20 family protein
MNALMKPQFGLMEDFRKEVDQLMGRFFHTNGENPLSFWAPRVNVAEKEDAYEVTADLPGMKPEEVNVELKNGELLISGQRNEEHAESGKTWHRVERHSGQFRRMIRLGDDVSTDKVSAEYKDGVLRIHVPKSDDAKSRKIEVRG